MKKEKKKKAKMSFEVGQVTRIPKIQVLIRKRPLTRKEKKKENRDIIDIHDGRTVIVKENK